MYFTYIRIVLALCAVEQNVQNVLQEAPYIHTNSVCFWLVPQKRVICGFGCHRVSERRTTLRQQPDARRRYAYRPDAETRFQIKRRWPYGCCTTQGLKTDTECRDEDGRWEVIIQGPGDWTPSAALLTQHCGYSEVEAGDSMPHGAGIRRRE
jgi:hypothetical protein